MRPTARGASDSAAGSMSPVNSTSAASSVVQKEACARRGGLRLRGPDRVQGIAGKGRAAGAVGVRACGLVRGGLPARRPRSLPRPCRRPDPPWPPRRPPMAEPALAAWSAVPSSFRSARPPCSRSGATSVDVVLNEDGKPRTVIVSDAPLSPRRRPRRRPSARAGRGWRGARAMRSPARSPRASTSSAPIAPGRSTARPASGAGIASSPAVAAARGSRPRRWRGATPRSAISPAGRPARAG